MGTVELTARNRRRNRNIQTAVLSTVALGGVIAVGAIAPNLVQLLALGKKSSRLKYQIPDVVHRLVAKKYLTFEKNSDRISVRVTEAGEAVLALEQSKMALRIQRKRRWDGRWRMVLFDIPERRRQLRDRLRATMKEAGFCRVQDSVWMYPYECEEFIALLKKQLTLGSSVLYAVIESLENDTKPRTHFKLTR